MSWNQLKIDDITEVVTKGTTPTTYGMPFTESGVNFIKAEALNGDPSLDRSGFVFVSSETHEKLKRSQLSVDDVLVTIAGANVGKCGFVTERDLPANTNQAVGLVRVDKEIVNPRYVYYFFKNPSTFALCQSLGAQAAQPNVNLTVLKGIKIPVPPLDTQDEIVRLLEAYDELIENNRRRIELLENSARELYKEWFSRFRFPGHEHVKFVDGVPVGWCKSKLGNIAETNVGSYTKRNLPDVINYVDISSVSQGRILNKSCLSSPDAPGRARRIAHQGDIIWSNVRPNLRAFALVFQPDDNDVFSTGFTVLSARKVPFSYLYQVTTTDAFVGYLVNHTTGASYPAVRPPDFERAEVLVPSSTLLDQFHNIVEPMHEMVFKLEQESRAAAMARDLLLPKIMSGEIAV